MRMLAVEVRDTSDDERYYPQGYFESAEAANAAIDLYFSEHLRPPCEECCDDGDFIQLEIVCLNKGWGTKTASVTREWLNEYDEGTDSYKWRELVKAV